MILVSQGGNIAFNLDHIYDIGQYDCALVATVDYSDEGKPLEPKLGVYATPERAKEVFDELVNCLGRAEIEPIGVIRLPEA